MSYQDGMKIPELQKKIAQQRIKVIELQIKVVQPRIKNSRSNQ